MSQREPTFIIFVIIIVLNIFCYIEVNSKERRHYPKYRRSMFADEITSNDTSSSSVLRPRLRSLAKQRRRVLLDSLIAQMSNSTQAPTIDWEQYGFRRNPNIGDGGLRLSTISPDDKETFGQARQYEHGKDHFLTEDKLPCDLWWSAIYRRPRRFSETGNDNGNVDGDVSDDGKDTDNGNIRPLSQTIKSKQTPYHKLVQSVDGKDDTVKKKSEFNPEGQSALLNVYSIGAQLRNLLSGAEYTNVTINCIGRTAEYNEIILLQATAINDNGDKNFRTEDNKYADDVPQKKIVFIVHGLSVMGFKEIPCLIVVKKFLLLLKVYFEHLDKFDIYLVPVANPDGLAHSYHFPLWNKNLSPQDACPGVALDRNFDISWQSKSSIKSCNQQYPGDHPFSEPETQAIRDVIHRHSHKIIAYIHVHGGGYHEHIYKGDAVLYPRGYSEATGDDDKYIDLKGEVDEVMKNASFKAMSVTMDTLYSWYGKVNGASVDYASTVYGIPYALEFVMQLYEVDPYAPNSNETLAAAAQDEIWHRLIDAILKHMYKTVVKHVSGSGDVRKYD